MSLGIKSFQNLLRRSKEEIFFIFEALYYLLLIKLFLSLRNFNYLAKKFSLQQTDIELYPLQDSKKARQIGWAVERVSQLLPWNGLCLVKALSAQRMLVKRNLQGIIYMGVKNSDDKKLEAHAWLRYNELFLTGRVGHKEFTVVSKFIWDAHE